MEVARRRSRASVSAAGVRSLAQRRPARWGPCRPPRLTFAPDDARPLVHAMSALAGGGGSMTKAQRDAVKTLSRVDRARGLPLAVIAERHGISERTVRRYLSEDPPKVSAPDADAA